MSLLEEAYTPCRFIEKRRAPDGYGGYTTEYYEGEEFKAAIRFDNSMIAKIAEQQGVTGLYTVITPKSLNLQYHEVFKRLDDGKIFRVTSDGDDNATPKSADLDMRAVSAEEWVLPNDK